MNDTYRGEEETYLLKKKHDDYRDNELIGERNC